jgi:hypothetical protein
MPASRHTIPRVPSPMRAEPRSEQHRRPRGRQPVSGEHDAAALTIHRSPLHAPCCHQTARQKNGRAGVVISTAGQTEPPERPTEKLAADTPRGATGAPSPVRFRQRNGREPAPFGAGSQRRRNSTDWLAVDAVSSEPVSGLNSLVTGRFTGNFAPRDPSCADQTARKCLPIGPFSAFGSCPVQNRAGNFRTGIRELSGGDQGILCP